MDAFDLHRHVIADYAAYTKSFVRIADADISKAVDDEIAKGLLWPEPLLQLNPAFEPGSSIDELVQRGALHRDCARIFRAKDHEDDLGRSMRLHLHQDQAIQVARQNRPYVLTTGTGSGKSLAYIIPIVDHVLRNGSGRGIQAIVVYPMNALANSQQEELDKFLKRGFGGNDPLVRYHRYTGQEDQETRDKIQANPPDIILTNYVMLEMILTRIDERRMVEKANGLKFLVFDELHTYRGRQGADVAMLIRRCRDAFGSKDLLCVGTSATMASEGTSVEQRQLVASVASRIFGQPIRDDDVIGETLRPNATEMDFQSPSVIQALKATVTEERSAPRDFQQLSKEPLAAWIESRFGIRIEEGTNKRCRQTPGPLKGEGSAAAALAELTQTGVEQAALAIKSWLEHGSKVLHPESRFPFFAFRLHQFITRGDTVWCSLEPADKRKILMRGQQFVPEHRPNLLLPLVFCRSCGQEYYRVNRTKAGSVERREDFDISSAQDLESGFLYVSEENPWPNDGQAIVDRVPEDWIEEHRGQRRVKRTMPVPETIQIAPDGLIGHQGIQAAFVPAPFRFCLNPNCGVAHNARQRSDAGKLATIGTDGRSTATSVLALSTILKLRTDPGLANRPEAQKLLSFTDNRQDASLQAGHFNDFVEVSLVRSALYRAMNRVGIKGLRYDDLVHHVEAAMDLPIEVYANDPELRGAALEETRRALRSVFAYFLYRDLQRGWRITSPNLEQCGLLDIDYISINDLAEDDKFWNEPLTNTVTKAKELAHRALVSATPEQRDKVIRVLLDHLRRSLIIKEDVLTYDYQERISDQSRQRLCPPWVLDDPNDLVRSGIAWPRSRDHGDASPNDIFLSPQSNFGLFLRHPGILPGPLTTDDARQIIGDLLKRLRPWGLVEEVKSPITGTTDCGYQVPSSVMLWRAGDGTHPAVDHLRMTQTSAAEDQTNQYFIQLYKSFAERGAGLEAREHTAQVPSAIREEREHKFRAGELDILFCSPTMELGVDISQLNVVNMRNVPPTPANYAQRSGRAGRSGQAAFVYTYCSGFSPHDQYYFKRPDRMVAGAVAAPRIDLHNQDLIRSHVHAIWLAESDLKLGKTLAEILIVSEENLDLPIRGDIRDRLDNPAIRGKALIRGQTLLNSIGQDLRDSHWYRDGWLEDVLRRIPQEFDAACDRWRSLYRAAVQQRILQNKIIGDHSRTQSDRDRAKRLRAQAEDQINLLTDSQSAFESDFYSYRYFASEGFLPGYNFPRLPLSAFIPARRGRQGRNEFLSRPRFLAISEFGPRAVIYHEGARYRVNKVNLSFDENTQELTEYTMKVCSSCGYGHLVSTGAGPDTCSSCLNPLRPTDEIREMVRLQNVTVKRVEQITSDEEERQRVGYEIQTTYRFSDVGGSADVRLAEVLVGDQLFATIRYGDAAQIWRINLGWRRRQNPAKRGFFLDVERGYWATNKEADEADQEDPMSKRIKEVIPYVEDHRNVLTIKFASTYDKAAMASLQSAFKQAIQQIFQLEPGELAAEALPRRDDRQLLFFYEATEGGAGVLRNLLDPGVFARIAITALNICHYDPGTGEDLSKRPQSGLQCEAACYDCLLEYGNQMDHDIIDRTAILPILNSLKDAVTVSSSTGASRLDQLAELLGQCDSDLEKKWLNLVHESNMRLPTHAQYLIESCTTRADFLYRDQRTAIFVDGPVHDQPHVAAEDRKIEARLKAAGILFIRFHHAEDWSAKLSQFGDIFGAKS